MKRYINKISNYGMVGGIGILAVFALAGCDNKKDQQDKADAAKLAEGAKQQGQFMVIQEVSEGKYKVVEQYPANGPSRAILKDMNGTEKLLSEAELRALADVEAKKVENNTSNLTRAPNEAGMSSSGMSLGETVLAGAAGALIGGYIANKLFSNPNFQSHQRAVAPTAMSKPAGGYKPQTSSPTTAAKPQSGYFKETTSPASSSSSASRPSSPSSSGGYSPSRSSGG